MKSCVVLAVSVFSEERAYVLREFMQTFQNKFSDCDFYVGINYNSIPQVESIIKEYGLNVEIARLYNSSLYCGSDASAYQTALSIMKEKGKQYDICWFAHTKGAVNDRPIEREMYLRELFGERIAIEGLFSTYEKLGSYALRGVSIGAGGDVWATFNHDHFIPICSNQKYDTLQYTHINWSYIETMYAIKGDAVEAFMRNVPIEFFIYKIGDPCYFEIVFSWIASRCGYFPYIKQNRCFWGSVDLKDVTRAWINENNLVDLHNYLHI